MSAAARKPGKLVMVRHGQSDWNLKNLFTGWTDVDLSEQGIVEAHTAGRTLVAEKLTFDIAFTSVLTRAIRTLWIILDEMKLMWIPVELDWRLNERHYGDLQGLDKAATAAKHGAAQVKIWRRSYDIPPPPLKPDDPRHPRHDPRYANLSAKELPATESLKSTLARVQPYWEKRIVPELKSGKNVLVAAHGNSLRALVKLLEGVSDSAITELNIPTGAPRIYEFDAAFKPVRAEYLGDADAIAAAARAVANQAGAQYESRLRPLPQMLYDLGPHKVVTAGDAFFVAPSAAVIGRVTLGRDVNIWFGAVVRGDGNTITIGERTNVQDNAVIHIDSDAPAIIGNDVTIGHSAVVHGCRVGDRSLIGIGATILSHAVIGKYCIVGAGALITERKEFPDRSVIIGSPAKRYRAVTDEEMEMLIESAAHYAELGRRYRTELHTRGDR